MFKSEIHVTYQSHVWSGFGMGSSKKESPSASSSSTARLIFSLVSVSLFCWDISNVSLGKKWMLPLLFASPDEMLVSLELVSATLKKTNFLKQSYRTWFP